jgi:catechol 2,3-dioxygenase
VPAVWRPHPQDPGRAEPGPTHRCGSGVGGVGFKVETSDDLADFESRAQQFCATTGRFSAGENLKVGDGLRLTLPSEHTVELYTDMEFVGTETGSINPDAWPRNMRGVGTHWIEVLDFRPAERAVESIEHPDLIATWLTCGESPHDLAVIKGPNNKIHHFAFHLEDWGAILKAGDIFSADDVPVDIGPTRHGITRGTTIYFFDPAGNRNEVFAGLGYRVHQDFTTIQMDRGPAGQGNLLPRPRAERGLHHRFHVIRRAGGSLSGPPPISPPPPTPDRRSPSAKRIE